MTRHRQSGQVMSEYVLGLLAVVTLLTVPIVDGRSAAAALAAAIHDFFHTYSYLVSIF